MADKSKLKLMPHSLLPDQYVIEVWHNEKFIATVVGADGPGVRVITKYPYDIVRGGVDENVKIIEVKIEIKGD